MLRTLNLEAIATFDSRFHATSKSTVKVSIWKLGHVHMELLKQS